MALIHEAIALHQAGDLDAAEQQYQAILTSEPDHPDALHLLGLINYAREEYDQAVEMVQQAINLAPLNSVYSFNLGNIYRDQGNVQSAETAYLNAISVEPDNAEYFYVLADMLDSTGQGARAVEYYKRATELEPDDAGIHLDLGACYQGQNQMDAAVLQYQAALAIDPTLAPAHNNLGGIFQALGEMGKAGSCYRHAIESDPELAEAHRNYAAILEIQGDTESALHHYHEALRINPDYDEVAFKVAALSGDKAPAVAPSGYVAGLFDQYAEEFDKHLTGTLGYRTPRLLREMFDRLAGESGLIRILDLGCGTGLSGEAFRDLASYMAGVDLSSRMIDKAAERGIYDELHCGDVVDALKRTPSGWGLLLAVDVLVYIGDLGDFMQAAASALKPGGSLLFSVEKSIQSGFVLGKSGRYAHNMDYLEGLAGKAGLTIVGAEETVLRKDYGNDVIGYVLMMQKP